MTSPKITNSLGRRILSWFLPAYMLCEHDPERVEAVAVINGVESGRRRFLICRKCGATSAMVRMKEPA